MGQELESGWAGQLWFGVSGLVAVRCWLGLQLSEGWTRAGGPASKVGHSHAGRWCFPHGLSAGLLECPRNMAAGFPPEWMVPEWEWARQKPCFFYDLALEVTQGHLGSILFVIQVSPVVLEDMNTGREDHWETPSDWLTTTPSYFSNLHLLNQSPVAGRVYYFHCFAIIWNIQSWKPQAPDVLQVPHLRLVSLCPVRVSKSFGALPKAGPPLDHSL